MVSKGRISEQERFLQMRDQLNLVLAEEYFPKVMKALKKEDGAAFREIATEAGVSPGVIDGLWEILLNVYGKLHEEIPWMVP